MTSDQILKELDAIALLTDRKTGVFAKRRDLWELGLAAGISQAELARHSGVGRADIVRGIKRGGD